ncbi:hypothetical protein CCP4SC76_3180003 [Gammaproteobacteria bacterium]
MLHRLMHGWRGLGKSMCLDVILGVDSANSNPGYKAGKCRATPAMLAVPHQTPHLPRSQKLEEPGGIMRKHGP